MILTNSSYYLYYYLLIYYYMYGNLQWPAGANCTRSQWQNAVN